MNPILVVVTGSPRRRTAVIGRLQTQLTRRGLGVYRMAAFEELPAEEPDVIILTGLPAAPARLAKTIERIWTRHWEAWYARSYRRVSAA